MHLHRLQTISSLTFKVKPLVLILSNDVKYSMNVTTKSKVERTPLSWRAWRPHSQAGWLAAVEEEGSRSFLSLERRSQLYHQIKPNHQIN